MSFTTGHSSEDWIKNIIRNKDGRRRMTALRDYFSIKGNATRIIAEAENFKDTFHYKNEHSLQFETFLTKFQKRTIYAPSMTTL